MLGGAFALVGVVVALAGCGGSSPRPTKSKPVDRIGVAQPEIVRNGHPKRKLTPAEHRKDLAEALRLLLSRRITNSAGEDEIVVEQPAKLTPAEYRKNLAQALRLMNKYCPHGCTFTAVP